MPSFGGAIRSTTSARLATSISPLTCVRFNGLMRFPLDAKTPLIIDGFPLPQREVRQYHARTHQYFFRSLLRLTSTRAPE
jgi:hypothetical protein